MHRRALVAAIVAAVSSGTAACLEDTDDMDDSPGAGGNEDPTDTERTRTADDIETETPDATADEPDEKGTDPACDDAPEGVRDTRFGVLGTEIEFDVSAAVSLAGDTVTVTGTIRGNNTCYTARLGWVTFEGRALTVNVESFDDSDDDEGCGEAIIGIDYEATVEFDSDLPTEVTVEHNGEHVTTEQIS